MKRVGAYLVGVGSLFLVVGCTASNPPTGNQQNAITGCTCDGTGPGGAPITVNCGDTACGEDDNTYLCNSPGGSDWTMLAAGCGADLAGVCTCNGYGPDGNPLSAACGSTACGSDNNTWMCNSPGGSDWSFAASGCSSGPPVDMAGSGCSCTGTGPDGNPVTVSCGSTACGSDDNTWMCNSPGGEDWSYFANGCTVGPPVDMASSGCSCNGTGPGGVPVTANCGSTACGSDSNTYLCNSPGGSDWSYFANGCCVPSCSGVCGGDDGCGGSCPDNCVLPQTCGGGGTTNVCGDCSCTGTGLDGNPVTAACGQTACGMDDNTWLCNSPGGSMWSYFSNGCSSGPVDLGGCSCTGTGPGGTPVTVNCGASACGSDNNTWMCNAPGGNNWSYGADGCTS